MLATMTSKGQVTVPVEIRQQLNLRPGDRLDFVLGRNNHVELIPMQGSLKMLKGALPKPKQPVSLDEMKRAIGKGGEA